MGGTYNTNSKIKFKTTMLKSSLCGQSDAYMFVKGINGAGADVDVRQADKGNKQRSKIVHHSLTASAK